MSKIVPLLLIERILYSMGHGVIGSLTAFATTFGKPMVVRENYGGQSGRVICSLNTFATTFGKPMVVRESVGGQQCS